ncbi:MAG: site-2 protease family protein [Ruminococcaceae bacterium]|nr:site-2 protease family protein [Oscillospiraceae bacterium]
MILSLLQSGNSPFEILLSLIIVVPAMMLALSVHETAHGFAAWKCGDPTAHNLGRLTLNPIRHLDPVGLIMLLLVGYGWAKPVPVNPRYFRDPKRGMAITALAGPLSNLLLGVLFSLLAGICGGIHADLYGNAYFAGGSWVAVSLMSILYTAFEFSGYINFLYAVFNMIPIPPFDGSRVAFAFLPDKYYFGIMRYEREIMYGTLILMVVLSRFGLSPFGIAAEWLSSSIINPIVRLVFQMIR